MSRLLLGFLDWNRYERFDPMQIKYACVAALATLIAASSAMAIEQPHRDCSRLCVTLAEDFPGPKWQSTGFTEWWESFQATDLPQSLSLVGNALQEIGALDVGLKNSRELYADLPFTCERTDSWCEAKERELESLLAVEEAQFWMFSGYGFDLTTPNPDRFIAYYSDLPRPIDCSFESYPDSCGVCFVRVYIDSCGTPTFRGTEPVISPDCISAIRNMVKNWRFKPQSDGDGWVETQIGIPVRP